jgi:hypothetical protein
MYKNLDMSDIRAAIYARYSSDKPHIPDSFLPNVQLSMVHSVWYGCVVAKTW